MRDLPLLELFGAHVLKAALLPVGGGSATCAASAETSARRGGVDVILLLQHLLVDGNFLDNNALL